MFHPLVFQVSSKNEKFPPKLLFSSLFVSFLPFFLSFFLLLFFLLFLISFPSQIESLLFPSFKHWITWKIENWSEWRSRNLLLSTWKFLQEESFNSLNISMYRSFLLLHTTFFYPSSTSISSLFLPLSFFQERERERELWSHHNPARFILFCQPETIAFPTFHFNVIFLPSLSSSFFLSFFPSFSPSSFAHQLHFLPLSPYSQPSPLYSSLDTWDHFSSLSLTLFLTLSLFSHFLFLSPREVFLGYKLCVNFWRDKNANCDGKVWEVEELESNSSRFSSSLSLLTSFLSLPLSLSYSSISCLSLCHHWSHVFVWNSQFQYSRKFLRSFQDWKTWWRESQVESIQSLRERVRRVSLLKRKK